MRYYFDTADGERVRDNVGVELPDAQVARGEAIRFAGEVLQSEPAVLDDSEDFLVEVSSEDGTLLFTVITMGVEAAAMRKG